MRFKAWRSGSLLLLVLIGLPGLGDAGAIQRGVVNAIALTPKAADTRTTISATVTGLNPCGAVFIDWGDGTAITHPIVDLPTTHTHAYTTPGNYTVRARGMGNCDGEATAAVRVDGPPAPASQPRLTGFNVASPGVPGRPVSMTLDGQGACTVTVAFGDGNTQDFSVQLPHTFTHVYSLSRGYNVSASARPPCDGGRHTVRLEVADGPASSRIDAIAVKLNPGAARGIATIQVAGSGACAYVLDYGDGNSERRTGVFPDRVEHVYQAAGTFVVAATAEPPCEGKVRDTLVVTRALTRPGGAVARLVVSPDRARIRSRISVTIEGRGTCRVFVDFDDGNEQTIEGPLPLRIVHSYARPGRYDVFAWTDPPCTGDASRIVQIER